MEFVPKIHQSVHLLHIEALILVGDQYGVLGSADVVRPKPDDVLVLLGLHVVQPLAGRHVGQEGSLAGDDLVADEAEGPVVH